MHRLSFMPFFSAVLLISSSIIAFAESQACEARQLATDNNQRFAATIGRLAAYSEQVTTRNLSNGIPVIIAEDRSAPLVAIQVWLGTGSIHEDEYLGAGISHAIEHMVFKGTETRPVGAIAREIQQLGGSINAYTAFDRTVFHTDLPANAWEAGLDILSDAVFNATFPEEEWVKEREVIFREMAMHLDNPDRALGYDLWRTAFRTHPHRHPVIGYAQVFESLTREDLLVFARRNYVPENIMVSVAGDIEATAVLGALERYFGIVPRRAWNQVVLNPELRQIAPRKSIVTDPALRTARMAIAFHTVSITDPDAVVLDVLAEVTGGGRAAQLYRETVEKGLAHNISAWSYSPAQPGLFGISASFEPENRTQLESVILASIEKWKQEGFTAGDIERAKARLLARELNGWQTTHGQASRLAAGMFFAGTVHYSSVYIDRLAQIEPKDLQAAAQKYLTTENRTTVWRLPAENGEPATPAAAEVSTQQLHRFTLSNGIPVAVRHDPRLPLAHVCIAIGGGVLLENDENSGISRLVSETMLRGNAKQTGSEIATAVERRGASLTAFSGMNSFGLRAGGFATDLPRILEIALDCLISPTFEHDEFENQRRRQLADIRREQERPMTLAQNNLNRHLFADHPYRLTAVGSLQAVEALTPACARGFLQAALLAGNIAVAVSGDVEPDSIRSILDNALGALPSGRRLPDAAADLHVSGDERIVIHSPHQQAIVLAGIPSVHLGSRRSEPLDFLQTYLSGMASPLFEDIREKRGLAYFTGAFHRTGPDTGAFVLYAGTHPDSVESVETALLEAFSATARNGLSGEEHERTLNRMLNDHARFLQGHAGVALEMALFELYGLGAEHVMNKPERLRAISSNDFRDAAQWLLEQRKVISIILPE